MSYSKTVMADVRGKGVGYETLNDEELKGILITLDGRGEPAKQKALEILLDRAKEKGYDQGYESGVDNERSRLL